MLSDLQMNQAAFDLWINTERCDNLAELDRVKRILPMILEECCTEKQLTCIMHYFADHMSMAEIAKLYGINKSTVCRQIHDDLDKAYPYLRFCSPLFIKTPKKRGFLKKEIEVSYE